MAEKEAETEVVAEEGAAEGEAPKKSKKKLIIIIAAVAVVLIGGGAGAYFGGLFGHKKAAEHAEGEAATESAGGEHGEKGTGQSVFYELPEFLVNLNSTSRQTSFLKMTISLELASPEDQAALQAKLPRVLDSFNTYLRELRATDLYGSAGLYRLREELLNRVNKAVEPVKVKDILFKQILVQ